MELLQHDYRRKQQSFSRRCTEGDRHKEFIERTYRLSLQDRLPPDQRRTPQPETYIEEQVLPSVEVEDMDAPTQSGEDAASHDPTPDDRVATGEIPPHMRDSLDKPRTSLERARENAMNALNDPSIYYLAPKITKRILRHLGDAMLMSLPDKEPYKERKKRTKQPRVAQPEKTKTAVINEDIPADHNPSMYPLYPDYENGLFPEPRPHGWFVLTLVLIQ